MGLKERNISCYVFGSVGFSFWPYLACLHTCKLVNHPCPHYVKVPSRFASVGLLVEDISGCFTLGVLLWYGAGRQRAPCCYTLHTAAEQRAMEATQLGYKLNLNGAQPPQQQRHHNLHQRRLCYHQQSTVSTLPTLGTWGAHLTKRAVGRHTWAGCTLIGQPRVVLPW